MTGGGKGGIYSAGELNAAAYVVSVVSQLAIKHTHIHTQAHAHIHSFLKVGLTRPDHGQQKRLQACSAKLRCGAMRCGTAAVDCC